jgi:cell division protease FtsH
MIAYHEVGHYIMHRKCQNLTDKKIDFVSILPMLDFLGVNYSHTILGKNLNYTKEYFEDVISMKLGGRVGESKITKKFSTGASADLDQANSCAKEMIMLYGLSENPKSQNRSYVYNYYYLNDSLMTEKMKKEINKEIQSIIDKGFKKADDIINENLGLLEAIVDELLKKEILTGEELEAICNEYEQSQSKTTK